MNSKFYKILSKVYKEFEHDTETYGDQLITKKDILFVLSIFLESEFWKEDGEK